MGCCELNAVEPGACAARFFAVRRRRARFDEFELPLRLLRGLPIEEREYTKKAPAQWPMPQKTV